MVGGGERLALLIAAGIGTAAVRGHAADLSFTRHIISTTNTGIRCISAADVDGDDDVDILTATPDNDTLTWYENDGLPSPSFTEHILSTDRNRPNFVLGVDMDGDGDTDILTSSSLDDTVSYYENDGGSPPGFTERIITEDPDGSQATPPDGFADGVRQVFAADLDGDEDLDVGSASPEDDTVAWYRNDGGSPPGWTAFAVSEDPDGDGPLDGTVPGARAIAAGDLDGDDDIDMVAGSWEGSTIAWYENDGGVTPVFTEHLLATFVLFNWPDDLANVWRLVTADLDGDDSLDVLAARLTGGWAWFHNDGGAPPAFAYRAVVSEECGGSSVHAADLDQDGDLDAAFASRWDDRVAWYENAPLSPLWIGATFDEHIITQDPDGPGPQHGVADGARTTFTADIDGDGDTDVLWGARFNSTIAWEENHLIDAETTCAEADANHDAVIGVTDLLALLGAWGSDPKGPPDLNRDARVDAVDLVELIRRWGEYR